MRSQTKAELGDKETFRSGGDSLSREEGTLMCDSKGQLFNDSVTRLALKDMCPSSTLKQCDVFILIVLPLFLFSFNITILPRWLLSFVPLLLMSLSFELRLNKFLSFIWFRELSEKCLICK